MGKHKEWHGVLIDTTMIEPSSPRHPHSSSLFHTTFISLYDVACILFTYGNQLVGLIT